MVGDLDSAVPLWVGILTRGRGFSGNNSSLLLYLTARRGTHAAVAMGSSIMRSTSFYCACRVNRLYRAVSYEMVGNFLAACNEHEAVEKLVIEGYASPPEPRLVLAMNTNRGIRCAYQEPEY